MGLNLFSKITQIVTKPARWCRTIHQKLDQVLMETQIVRKALADPNGFGHLKLLLYNLHVKPQYESVFYELPESAVCLDCGANCGLFTDLVLERGAGEVHAFEPQPSLVKNLERKYRDEPRVRLVSAAVSDQPGTVNLMLPRKMADNYLAASEGGSISVQEIDADQNFGQEILCPVAMIRLVDYLQNQVFDHVKEVYILKIDIEGAEFDVMADLLRSGLCARIRYIFCETHERFFKDGPARLARIQTLIKEQNLTNVYLDWE